MDLIFWALAHEGPQWAARGVVQISEILDTCRSLWEV